MKETKKEIIYLTVHFTNKTNAIRNRSLFFLLTNHFGRLDFMPASSHMHFGLLADNEIYMRISFV